MLFVFCSGSHDANDVASALARRFPGVPMAGCTTAGEHLCGAHLRNAVVLAGLCDTETDWAVASFDGLDALDERAAETFAHALFTRHGVDSKAFDPDQFVGLLFVDGLAGCEERISAALAAGLHGIALAGGSAGDDLAFERTQVICNGTAASDRATVVLARSETTRFELLKHQHFTTEPEKMLAVTRADTANRRVFELDGHPAARAYAAALGIERSALTAASSFRHPVVFRCEGELYVRSIREIHDDDSLTFYCSIEEGMVLELGAHTDISAALHRALGGHDDSSTADFMLEFNCVLRALETTETNNWGALGDTVRAASKSSIGFDTYGEQLNGLHINQTLVAVRFTSQREAA